MRIVGQNSDVHFGEVDEEEPDWRNELEEETDPDDDELEYTPQDVIDILGFDPKEFSEPEPTSNESNPMSLNTTKAILILNAKKSSGVKNPKMKGWTDEARKKAAMTRKAKKIAGKSGEAKPNVGSVKEWAKTQSKINKASEGKKTAAYQGKTYKSVQGTWVPTSKKVAGKSGETAPKKKKVKRPLIDPKDRNLDPSTLIEGQNQTSTGRKGYYN